MNNKIILGIIGVVVVAGIAVVAFKGGNAPQVANNGGVYCSSDGTLTSTMPIQSHRSYCLKTDSNGKTYSVNAPNEYSFLIVDDQGNTLKNFEITHTKLMHVLVARKDLAYFQHVHPEFDQTTGTFTFKDLTFPADGVYRIFADFAPGGGQKGHSRYASTRYHSEDVPVGIGESYTPQHLDQKKKQRHSMAIRFRFHLTHFVSGKETVLAFNLKQNGKPITDLQEYLGALGHSVILREGNLDFIHAHPMEDINRPQTGEVGFMVRFPEAGKYKVFTQFQRGGKVFTTDFVLSVAQGANQGSMNSSMPNVNHSMMGN